jgi:hypothetical protein
MSIHLIRYNRIVHHFLKNPPSECFCEKHHIVPRCLGGSDSKDNIVILPARAHFICHYMLHKAYPENSQLAHAFAMMSVSNASQNRKTSSRMYEASKIARSNALKGKPRPEWVKQKLRKPKSSKLNYFGNTNGKGNLGKPKSPRSESHREALALAMKPVYEARKVKTAEKIKRIREQFVQSKLSRKQFSAQHNITMGLLKRYLRGL